MIGGARFFAIRWPMWGATDWKPERPNLEEAGKLGP